MTKPTLLGLHHVTAMTGDAQANIDFYTGVLGLRMVKLTVNFDDPTSYHLYYGDTVGSPGSAMTFFVWPGAHRGRHGTGQATATTFAVPAGAIDYWRARMSGRGLAVSPDEVRFGERVIRVEDPDGLGIELAGSNLADARQPWDRADVSPDHAIRGFHAVTLSEEGYESTARLLTDTMGYKLLAQEGNRFRYAPTAAGPGAGHVQGEVVPTYIDVLCQPDARRGSMGVGTVHHVALRTPDDEQQLGWLQKIRAEKLNVSPIMDRKYFQSIYYREPGGVLFEIATDRPGFTVDETIEQLGSALYLPPWLEPHRSELVKVLPPIQLPAVSPYRAGGAAGRSH